MAQQALFGDLPKLAVEPFTEQLLKWIGNKQRFAHEIVSYFPDRFGRYFEPFLGSGAVLGTLAPREAVASDVFTPLIQIWQTLHQDPQLLVRWYTERWERMNAGPKVEVFEEISGQADQFLAELKDVIASELGALNTAIGEADVPPIG